MFSKKPVEVVAPTTTVEALAPFTKVRDDLVNIIGMTDSKIKVIGDHITSLEAQRNTLQQEQDKARTALSRMDEMFPVEAVETK